MDWNIIIRESVWTGIALSVLLTALVIVIMRWNKEIFYDDYPADVKAKWGPMSEKAKRQRIFFAIPLFAVMFGSMIYMPMRLSAALGADPSFAAIFVGVLIVILIFDLVDAFIIDLGFLYL